jgi:hypothetical protein
MPPDMANFQKLFKNALKCKILSSEQRKKNYAMQMTHQIYKNYQKEVRIFKNSSSGGMQL